jgi:predicted transcriptional regulator
VLDCLGESPQAASDLADRLDASRATVYRRLDRLTDAGLVRGTVSIDADGHHRQEFHIATETATIQFGGDGVSAAVEG